MIDSSIEGWDQGDSLDRVRNQNPDILFEDSVTFHTYQAAIQCSLELMGTTMAPIPVIMPVTAPPDTLAAVMRSGAQPLLLDVDVATLQVNATDLRDALEDLENAAIVLLSPPPGQEVDPAIQEIVKNQPTLVECRTVPNREPKSLGMFTVYDLENIIGTGGLVHHKYEDGRKDLKRIRSGIMGHCASLSHPLSNLLRDRVRGIAKYKKNQEEAVTDIMRILKYHKARELAVHLEGSEWPHFLVNVEGANAKRVTAHLRGSGFGAKIARVPAHHLKDVKQRWTLEDPNYPGADYVSQRLVALPTNMYNTQPNKALSYMEDMIECLLEVL